MKYCTALILSLFLGIAAISGGDACAAGLSMEVDIQQEFYRPLVPVAQHFETCFTTDPATGIQVMSLCTSQLSQQRAPASSKAPNNRAKLKK